jgi:hypothetical protein
MRPGSLRDRLAAGLALLTIGCLAAAFVVAKGTQFLMPGQLTSAHGAIENCGACHTKNGSGKLSWIHGLVAGDPLADSKACLTCHKMPDTAFNAHGAAPEVLKRSTDRLTKVAAATPAPTSARMQNIAFPAAAVESRPLYCAGCHQEHKGVNFNLNKISNEQCRSCHVVKFDSFDGNHPKFDNYPFKRRTRIVYDHAGHFGKHFPEIEKKNPTIGIPATCSACHNSRADRRVMAVAPSDQTCMTCHLNQITGKERASGPKGIAFLSLPGLDVATLKEKKAQIGEWPESSEAALTPFMKVMISRNERGRTLIKTVDSLNLQDLSGANAEQIKAVTELVWSIKKLFYSLIKGKASDVLADLKIGGSRLSPNVVADLTASLPRDVVIGTQQQWLPNLGAEMAGRPETSDQDENGWSTVVTESRLAGSVPPEELPGFDTHTGALGVSPQARGGDASAPVKPSRLAQANQQVQTKNAPGAVAAKTEAPEPETAPGKIPVATAEREAATAKPSPAATAEPEAATAKPPAATAKPDAGKIAPAADQPPPAKGADQTDDLLNSTGEAPGGGAAAPAKDTEKATQPEAAARKPAAPSAPPPGGAKVTLAAGPASSSGPVNQDDDLLNPNGGGGSEAAGAAAPSGGGGESAPPAADAPADTSGAPAQAKAAPPVISIESDVDPESWAEYGGWYRQDYAIFYRPTGHKDKFIYSWLFLSGPKAPKGERSPAAAVFDYLTSKDAQGSCTKCHSVDDLQGNGRLVNFSPPKPDLTLGRFTNFIHEPHFGIMKDRGCLTCHNLEKDRPYLKSFEQGDPTNFVSNFGAVKKDVCQTCHTSSMARQDCLTCHKYHVNGVITPVMNTKIPTQ